MVMKPWWVMIDTDRKTETQHFTSEGEALAYILSYFGWEDRHPDEDITSLEMLQDIEDSADDPDALHPNLFRWDWGYEAANVAVYWMTYCADYQVSTELSTKVEDVIRFAHGMFLPGTPLIPLPDNPSTLAQIWHDDHLQQVYGVKPDPNVQAWGWGIKSIEP